MAKPKALLIVHQAQSDTARVGALIESLGYQIDRRCPNLGCSLPTTMDDHEAVVIFGGPMSANDRDNRETPGIRAELDFLPTVLDARKPFLGICLGAQILARVLGAGVDRHPDGRVEAGYYRIRPTEAGRRYFAGPMMVYQWHREGFDLPHGATLLAEGEIFPHQAFRYGQCAYGLQFHPEVLESTIRRWIEQGTERLSAPGACAPEMHLDGFRCHDRAVDAWIRTFLATLLGGRAASVIPEAAD